MTDYLRITYRRSAIGRNYHQKRTIKALGLRRLHQSRMVQDTPSIRGMINKVRHLLEVERDVNSNDAVEQELLAESETRVEKEDDSKSTAEPEAEIK